MGTFMVGVLMALVPGLVTGYVLAGLVGWAMRRDDYCRHPLPTPSTPGPTGGGRVVGQPVAPRVAPTVVYVYVHQPDALAHWSPSRVIDAQVVGQLPAGGVTP